MLLLKRSALYVICAFLVGVILGVTLAGKELLKKTAGQKKIVLSQAKRVYSIGAISLQAPESWDAIRKQTNPVIALKTPREDNDDKHKGSLNVVVRTNEKNESLDEYYEKQRSSLRTKHGKNFAPIAESLININGVSARRIAYRVKAKDNVYHNIAYVLTANGKFYTIICGMRKSNALKWNLSMQQVAESLIIH